MKHMFKKFLLLFCFCMVLLGLTGCVERTTIVQLNADYSGNRTMKFAVSESLINNNLLVDMETLDAVVKESCPEELEFSYEATDSGYSFLFVLSFQTIEEYKEKLSSLAGREVEIDVHVADTPFSTGISVKEDCETKELLAWLPDVLVEHGCITAGNSDYILDDGNNTVITSLVYEGDEYFSWTKDQVNIEEIDYVAMNGICIYTELEDERIARVIVIDVPGVSFEKKGDELQAFLEGHVPEAATFEWKDGNQQNKLFTISIPFCSYAEMENAMQHFCESEDVHISREERNANSLYGVSKCLKESFDLSIYISDNPNSVNSTYYLKNRDGIILAEVERLAEDEVATYSVSQNDTFEEYLEVSRAYAVQYDLNYGYEQIYQPMKATVTTEVSQDGIINQRFEMQFDEVLSDEIEKQILQNVEKTIPESMQAEWSNSECSILMLTVSGDRMELKEALESLISEYSIDYHMDKSFFKPKNSFDFSFQFSIESIFPENRGEVTYVFRMPGGIDEVGCLSEQVVQEDKSEHDRVYTVLSSSSSISLEVEGSMVNISGIIVLAVIVLFVVLCTIGLYLKKNSKKNKVKDVPQIVKQYCVGCGSEIVANAAFCEECGLSIKDSIEGGNI